MKRWWIAEPRLLGCSNPDSRDVEALAVEGFGFIVSLLDEGEQAPGYDLGVLESLGLERYSIPVRDFRAPTTDQLIQFLQLIDDANGKRGVLHCLGGSGRTGTFAAAYWIGRGMTAREAILRIRRSKPAAVETREQIVVLAGLERALRKGGLASSLDGNVNDDLASLPTGAEIRASRLAQP